jgi:hypothetical protein
MVAAAATTLGDATSPTDLTATLAGLQARVTAAKAEAQRARVAAAALELQLAVVLGVIAPPPSPATTAASAPTAAVWQEAPAVGAFETSSVGYTLKLSTSTTSGPWCPLSSVSRPPSTRDGVTLCC